MIEKIMLCPDRVRRITGTFGFIEHRFLKDGFFYSLTHHELLLYFFLVLAADRDGLSFYGYDRICTFLKVSLDEYIQARDGLIAKDLLAFDGRTFQLLSLPACRPKSTPVKDPAKIRQLINRSLGGSHDR
jgi:hypothetical protein